MIGDVDFVGFVVFDVGGFVVVVVVFAVFVVFAVCDCEVLSVAAGSASWEALLITTALLVSARSSITMMFCCSIVECCS